MSCRRMPASSAALRSAQMPSDVASCSGIAPHLVVPTPTTATLSFRLLIRLTAFPFCWCSIDAASVPGPQGLAQAAAVGLAVGIQRHLGDEPELLGHLVAGEQALAVLAHAGLVELARLAGDDEGDHALAPLVV